MLANLLIILSATSAIANDAPPEQRGFVNRIYSDETGEHPFVVFVPQGQPPQQGWPVILFLHGAGERGTDGHRQLEAGLGPLVKMRADAFPAVVVFPQAVGLDRPILQTWSADAPDGHRALAILDEVEAQYPVDPKRRVLTGWSMGGYGTWLLAAAEPTKWSAVVPIAGGGDTKTAPQLTHLNLWAFHGTQDELVPVSEGRSMTAAVRDAGGQAAFTEVADAAHDVWRRVYDSDVVLNWMLSSDHQLPDLETFTLPEDRTQSITAVTPPPFVPAMIIEKAIALRLGVDAMTTLAHGIPALVDERGGITGELEDVSDQLEMDDRTFDVSFSGLTFTGSLDRSMLHPRGPDRLQAEFAVRNFKMQIAHIEVTDGEVGFQAGPAEIVIGHREPVWLRVEIRPAVVGQQLSLKLLRSSFKIPDNNWYVSSPESIQLQGDWLTEREVETAVVGGVYVRKELIEEEVLSAIPSLLEQLAADVNFDPLAEMVKALWPLSVYPPNMQIHPESVSTDDTGVSLTLSVALAPINPVQQNPLQIVQASAPPAYEIEKSTDLRASVAVDVLDHLSSLIAGTSDAQIYTSDIPGRPFHELADLSKLSRAIPGLARFPTDSEVWARLRLEAPIHLRPNDIPISGEGEQTELMIAVPQMSLQLSVIPPSSSSDESTSSPVVPLHVLDASLHVQQPATLAVTGNTGKDPGLRFSWGTDTQVTAIVNPSEGNEEINAAELASLFEQGWRRWAASQTQDVVDIPTIAVGETRMTLTQMDWSGLSLSAHFLPATTTIRNTSDETISYLVRGPDSRWSKVRTLVPGDVSTYRTGTELTLRPHLDWQFDMMPLPPGTTWEWRSAGDSKSASWTQVAPLQVSTAAVTDTETPQAANE
ncbi:MAG: alpha/beta hydrolase-fold protein [Planctomycetaceae bacterium]